MDTTKLEGYPLFEQALYTLVHDFPGGVPAVAALLNLTSGTVQNKANPGQDHQFTLPEYVSLLAAHNNLDPQYRLNHLLGLASMPLHLPEMFTDGGFLDVYARWNAEVGETHSTIRQVLEDGELTQEEFDLLSREIDEDIDKELQVREYMRSLIKKEPE